MEMSNNIESRPEQEPLSPEFLAEQVRLPREAWDEHFRKLIAEKSAENQKEIAEGMEESPEPPEVRTFHRYLEGLGLDENALRGKKILDLGCGEEGEFVKHCLERGITAEAYGVDAQADESAVPDNLKGHILKGYFENEAPIRDADYVISVGAISNSIWGGEEQGDTAKILERAVAAMKEGGEVRMYPMQEAAVAAPLEGLEASQKKWREILEKFSAHHGVEYQIEPRAIKVAGNANDIILESVLVLRKKKNS
ncbi:MAG: class I SAM-dependent methyltransferase [Candidatus Jorgensenbacteria bacterium]